MKKDKAATKTPVEADRNAKKMISVNRRARHDYEIEDAFAATSGGLTLTRAPLA